MKFEIYNIEYNEDFFNGKINFKIIKNSKGALHTISVLIAEDDLYFAKSSLDLCDVKF